MAAGISIVFFVTETFSDLPDKIRKTLLQKGIYPDYFGVTKEKSAFEHALKEEFPDLVIVCFTASERFRVKSLISNISVPLLLVTDDIETVFPGEIKAPWMKKISRENIDKLNEIVLLLGLTKAGDRARADDMGLGLMTRIFNSAQELIVITQGDQLKYYNSRVKEYYGLKDDELLTSNFWNFIHPEDREKVQRERDKRLSGMNDEAFYQFRGINPKGEVTWFLINGFRIDWEGKPATLNFLIPINEQKKAEEEIRNTKKFLDDIIEFSPDGIIILDSERRICRMNRAIVEHLGVGEKNVAGRKIEEIPLFQESRLVEMLHLQDTVDDFNGISREITIGSRYGKAYNMLVQRTNHSIDRSIILWFRDITEDKKKANEILERELKYRTILEYSPIPIFSHDYSGIRDSLLKFREQGITDMRGYLEGNRDIVESLLRKIVILDCNNETLKFFGVRDVGELQAFLTEHINDELVKVFIDVAIAFWKGENVHEMEVDAALPHRKPSIIIKWILVPGHELSWDMVLTSITDISDRLKYEKQLKVLSGAIDHSPVSVIITDPTGRIEYVNPKFTEVTGYTKEEAVGKNPGILKSGNLPASLYENLWKTISEGKEWRGEFENKRKNGELFWEMASISGIKNEQGEIIYYVAIKEDITERKKTELELVKAKEKAEESDRLKTAFLANLSHEIRTPLNAIIGFSDILRSNVMNEQQRNDYFSIIEQSSHTLLKLIDDIIDVAKIEANHIRIVPHEFDLTGLMNELYLTFGREIKLLENGVELKLSVPDKKEFLILADATRVRQILSNLLQNAIKFTQKGSIEFGYVIGRDSKTIEFFVRDTGIGIPKDKLKVIFNRFRQVDDSTTREFGGTGLGLWISKNLAELMSGNIYVESKEGSGSTFFFVLPLEEGVVVSDIRPSKENEKEKRGIDWSTKIILIAEDNDSNYEYLKAVLSVKKANVLRARNGKEVLDKLDDHSNVDLVLMDINMPELNGYETTRLIKKMYPGMPVIAQTAFAMSEDRGKSIEAGCDEYIAKPIQARKLIDILKKFLDFPTK